LLPTIYPNHPWDISKLATSWTGKRAGQAMLVRALKEIFPIFGTVNVQC
jgi:hypothetical protein